MVTRTFYVEDTCALKSNPSQLGQVDRTFADDSSHQPHPRQTYRDGLDCSKKIPKSVFREFLRTGIPARGTVLVSWNIYPWQKIVVTTLLQENELVLIDRCLIFGDVVKRRVEDAMSGTVIQTHTFLTLLQPTPWPKATSSTASLTGERFGNYSPDKDSLLRYVSVDDLEPPNHWNVGQFIIYKDWVGKIESVEEEVYLRLPNGSVVVVHDPEQLKVHERETLAVGDYINTKKGNLRRGRWIYGAFNPAIQPEGYIAEIRAKSLDVDWLCSRYPAWSSAPSEQPPDEIDEDLLASGEVHLYDRRRQPSHVPVNFGPGLSPPVMMETESTLEKAPALKKIDMDVYVGDRVRFRDISAAAMKYGGNCIQERDSRKPKLTRVSRMDAYGYDINVFQVAETKTMATVLWQDLTISQLPSTKTMPYLDADPEDEMWPGELIATKSGQIGTVSKPDKIGIIQSVNAQDRMAQVKWFPEGVLSFTEDEHPVLMQNAKTGQLSDVSEEISLYDIRTLPALTRKLGDFVVIFTDPSMKESHVSANYQDVILLMQSTRSIDWFGEVIELGLDGLLTVRLGAARNVRDVKIPWECTYLGFSSDFADDEHDGDYDMETDEDEDYDDDEFYLDDDNNSVASELLAIKGSDGVWRDVVDGVDEDDDMGDWTTEEDDDYVSEDDILQEDTDMQYLDAMTEQDPAPVVIAPNWGNPIVSSFSYGNMFYGPSSVQESASDMSASSEASTYIPDAFAILAGQPPQDHHFANRAHYQSFQHSKRIQKEYKILQSSLPDGIYVRAWESALDLLRVLILGPIGTPYEFAPFVIDFYLDQDFPNQPPKAFFHSWTNGTGPINPNLYEDGKICLSLLGTWPGEDKTMTWSTTSTVMQVIVSLVGLVLVEEPFYNEAGYESRAGTLEARLPSAIYSERTYFRSRSFITHVISHPVSGFEREIKTIYLGDESQRGPQLLKHATRVAIDVMRRSMRVGVAATTLQEGRTISAGALVLLRRQVVAMIEVLKGTNTEAAAELEAMLEGLASA